MRQRRDIKKYAERQNHRERSQDLPRKKYRDPGESVLCRSEPFLLLGFLCSAFEKYSPSTILF